MERTECVVRCASARTLITPANETLVGTALPYFPRGGPCPPPLPRELAGRADAWGALETGPGFVFPAQAVDGVVGVYGGKALREACARLPLNASGERCGVGRAVATDAPGALRFDAVVHAVGPFWATDHWADELRSTYLSALRCADALGAGSFDVATPLLGSGARGAPVADAAAVAADAAVAAAGELRGPARLVFGVVDPDAFDALRGAFDALPS